MDVTIPETSAADSAPKRAMSDTWYSILLITPAMLIILFFALFPLGYAINLSLRHVDLTSAVGIGPFVGLDNYRFALNDKFFWQAARRTLTFAVFGFTVQRSRVGRLSRKGPL